MFLGLTLARADVPGSAVSAAGFGAGEEQVHVRLDVRLLPPQVRRACWKVTGQPAYNIRRGHGQGT